MTQCNNPRCESTELVYSGVDAMCLGGIPTEEFCYSCAVGYVTIQNRIAELQQAYEEPFISTLTTSC